MATAQLLDRIQELEGQLPRAQMLGCIGASPSLPHLCRHIARQFASECSVFGRRDLGEAENTGLVWAAKIAQHERQDRRQATTLGDAGRSEGGGRRRRAPRPLAVSGPCRRWFFLQMQQLALMQKQLPSKQPTDAQAALTTGSDSSTGSTNGIEGCLLGKPLSRSVTICSRSAQWWRPTLCWSWDCRIGIQHPDF